MALQEQDQSFWVAFPVKSALPQFCPWNKKSRRRQPEDRWRWKGSKGSWGSRSPHPRLQAAPGSCSHSPNANYPRLLEVSSGSFWRKHLEQSLLVTGIEPPAEMATHLNWVGQLPSKMLRRTCSNAQNLPYVGDISQVVPRFFMLYVEPIYFHSVLTANKLKGQWPFFTWHFRF